MEGSSLLDHTYVNGAVFGTGTHSGSCTFDKIARYSTEYLDGQLDDVRIYNRALSEEEIKFLASPCNNPGRPPGAMLYNQDHAVLQYCNGKNWVGVGK